MRNGFKLNKSLSLSGCKDQNKNLEGKQMKINYVQLIEISLLAQQNATEVEQDFILYCQEADLDPEASGSWEIYYDEAIGYY
jgi:hypothetical protein